MSLIQEQKDELTELRQQAYEALMSIGAQIPAEKIILNDLSQDQKFNLERPSRCVVGWAYDGTSDYVSRSKKGIMFNERTPCITCYEYSLNFDNYQRKVERSISYRIIEETFDSHPTEKFLKDIINFTDHFKSVHR